MPERASMVMAMARTSTAIRAALVIIVCLYVLSYVTASPQQLVMAPFRSKTSAPEYQMQTSTSGQSQSYSPILDDAQLVEVDTDSSTYDTPSSALWAITYTPYTSSGACKTDFEVLTDIDAIAAAGFTAIRLYSTDCEILSNPDLAPTLRDADMGLVVGLHVSDGDDQHAAFREQLSDVTAFAAPDVLQMVVVGNEAIFNGFASAPQLATLLREARAALAAAGYDGPVTTTEPLDVLALHAPTLCPLLDVLASNIQPFFSAGCAPASAGLAVRRHLDALATVCGAPREAWNLETGWPAAGDAHYSAVPGRDEQRVAVEAIWKEAGSRSAFHAFEDELWKADGEFGVERYWGCMDVFR